MIYKISFKKDIHLAFTEWLLVIDFSIFDMALCMLLVKEVEVLSIEYIQGNITRIDYTQACFDSYFFNGYL